MFRKLLLISACVFKVNCAPQHIDTFLEEENAKFDNAKTREAKFAVVSQPLNLTYLERLLAGALVEKAAVRKDVSSDILDCRLETINVNTSNVLMIAISFGRVDLVSKFLTVIDDINNPKLYAWGFKQPYFPAHMAMHPEGSVRISMVAQLNMIRLIGQAGADFNYRPPFICSNPPLAAGLFSGDSNMDLVYQRQAYGLLCGAKPKLKGTVFAGIDLQRNKKVFELAFSYFLNRVFSESLIGLKIDLTVKNIFKDFAKERADLDECCDLSFGIINTTAQINTAQKKISLLRMQKTKKSKAKQRHLLAVKESLEAENKKLTNRLSKLKPLLP